MISSTGKPLRFCGGAYACGGGTVAAGTTGWGGGVVALAGGTLTTDPIAVLGNVAGFGLLGGAVTDGMAECTPNFRAS